MSIELWILLYVLCGIAVWLERIWSAGSLSVKDLFFLPVLATTWPGFLVVLVVFVLSSGVDRVLWERKK